MSFVEWARNVIVLGPSGVGKTDLAIALANKAVEAGYSVLFLTLEELIGRLVRAAKESRLERSLQQLTYPKGSDHRRDRLPCRCPASRPVCSSGWSCATSGPAWSSPATRASWTGARCSATRCWPQPS